MKTNEIAVSATNLTKQFDHFTAVNRINVTIRKGEIFGFLGPNGSGKTTTIRMMLGLLKPTEGEIRVLGEDIKTDPGKIRNRVGYMSQRFSLYNDLTVMQNLLFYGRAYNLSNQHLQDRIRFAIEMSGLEGREHIQTRDLSGGWRQRLSLSAAILHQPDLVFLDEPTAGVDPVSRRIFWELLYRLVEEGITIFVTTHYMDEAEHCQRLAFIQHGSIIASGTPVEIKNNFTGGSILEIVPQNTVKAMKALEQISNEAILPVQEVTLYGERIHVVMHKKNEKKEKSWQKKLSSALKSRDIKISSSDWINPSLEDIFISCMKNTGKPQTESINEQSR